MNKNQPVDERFRKHLYETLDEMDSDALNVLWREADEHEWSADAIELAGRILKQRLGRLPAQSPAARARKWLRQAEAALAAEDHQQVLKACEKALALQSNLALAYHYRGLALDELERSGEARTAFQAALQIDPDLREARRNLQWVSQDLALAHYQSGLEYEKQNRPDQAREEYQQALQLDPKLKDARDALRWLEQEQARKHNQRGLDLDERGKRWEAMLEFRVAMQLDPNLADARQNLLWLEEELEEEFGQSREMEWLRQACELIDLGDPEGAVILCERARKKLPDLAVAWNYLGIALQGAGRLEEAVEAFEQACRLNPTFANGRTNLANARVRLEEEQYRRIAEYPNDPDESLIPTDIDPKDVPWLGDPRDPAPQWLYLSEAGYLMKGFAGHRNRQGRIGLDPLDTDFEQAHLQGTLIHKSLNFHLRTRNPIYLILMTWAGILLSLPLLGLPLYLHTILSGYWYGIINLGLFLFWGVAGVFLLTNVLLSLVSPKSREACDQGSAFY